MIASVNFSGVLVVLALYLAPSIVGFARNMPNKGIICVINVFLGWTFIGWVIALAWACKARVPVTREVKVSLDLDSTSPERPVTRMYSPQSSPGELASVEPTAFCPTCGDKTPPDARFCKACGTGLTAD